LRDLDGRNTSVVRQDGQNHAREKTIFTKRFKQIPMAGLGPCNFFVSFFRNL
jgi:hypothetical protein